MILLFSSQNTLQFLSLLLHFTAEFDAYYNIKGAILSDIFTVCDLVYSSITGTFIIRKKIMKFVEKKNE